MSIKRALLATEIKFRFIAGLQCNALPVLRRWRFLAHKNQNLITFKGVAIGETLVGRAITRPPKKPNQCNRKGTLVLRYLFQNENIFHGLPKYIIRSETTFVNRQKWGGGNMDEREPERITLPEDLQLDMLKFFLRTSIPRIKKEKQQQAESPLSEKNSDKE